MHVGLNAHLLSGQPGYRSAGVHSYIHHLLTELAAAAPPDWRFTALVGGANPATYPGLSMRRAPFDTEAPLRRIVWEQVVQPWSLHEFDLYHALAFVAPLALSTPAVVTIYDLSFIHYPERLPPSRRLYLRLLTGLTCRRARRVIAISHSTAKDVETTYGIARDRIDVAACGYDASVYRPLPDDEVRAFRAAHNLPERFWLFIGTLEPRKNLVTLFEAYARLAPSERLPLIIGGGKGWQYDEIFATVDRLQLNAFVQFVGFIPTDVLALWYNSADSFVYPSVYEGFGLPVLEAMACGTPVLVANTSSLPEVVGDAGMSIAPHDVEAWSAALRRAAGDDLWRVEARSRGFIQAARFTWADTAAQTIQSYQQATRG